MNGSLSLNQTAVGDIVRLNALRFPNKAALIEHETDEQFTWRQLDDRVNRLSQGLAGRLGIGKGDRVFVMMNNGLRYYEINFALSKLGAVHVPINTMLSAEEQIYVINNSEAGLGLVQNEWVEYFENKLRPRLDPALKLVGLGRGHGYEFDYERLIAESPDTDPRIEIRPEDTFAIVYTGGSTAPAKGAVWAHGNVIANSYIQAIEGRLRPEDVFVGVVPAYTTAGFFQPITSMLLGNTHITMRWSAETFIETIVRRKATTTVIAPTMLLAVVNSLEEYPMDVSVFRVMHYGSAPMPFTTLKRAMEHFKCSWIGVYGSTETCGLSHIMRPEDHTGWENDNLKRNRLERLSIGSAAVFYHNRVLDEDGREVPKDGRTVGEFVVKGPSTCRRYWKSPEETKMYLKNGCWHSGDMAYWDEDGYIYLVDRKKDMIISGGMNVYSSHVERELYKHPAVNEVIVIGVPDDKWGEAVKAVVRLKPDQLATGEEIIDWAKDRLAKYEVPKSIDFVDDFPRSGYKILKRVVRDGYWRGRERKV